MHCFKKSKNGIVGLSLGEPGVTTEKALLWVITTRITEDGGTWRSPSSESLKGK